MKRAWLLGLCLGCGSAGQAKPDAAVQQAELVRVNAGADAGADAGVARAETPFRGPEVRALEGPAVQGVVVGQRLAADTPVTLVEGQLLTLDFPHGARVLVAGPARVQVPQAAMDGLLCQSGRLSIDLPPGATTPGSGFWLTAPSARVDLVHGGRLALRVFEGGALQLAMVSGSANLTRGLGEEQGRVQALLSAGERARVGRDVVREPSKAHKLEDTFVQAAGWRAPKPPFELARLDEALTQEEAQLREALAEQRRLVQAHRDSLRTPEVMARQAALSAHAATLGKLRRRVRTLLEQQAAAQLGGAESERLGALRELLGPAP